MKRAIGSVVVLLGLMLGLVPATAEAQWPQYSGQVFAIKGHAQAFSYDFVKTGLLYSKGDEKSSEVTLASVYQPGILSAVALRAFTGAAKNSNQVKSEAELASLYFMVFGNQISASKVGAFAEGACAPPSPLQPLGGPVVPQPRSHIANLVVNGAPIVITGQPNQVVQLLNGRIIINEQQRVVAGNTAYASVNALHVIIDPLVPGGQPLADVVFSSAAAYDICECPGTLYGALTAGAEVNVPAASAALLSSHRIGGPFSGEELMPVAQIENVLTLHNVRTSMQAGNNQTRANTEFASLDLDTAGVKVTASALSSTAIANCSGAVSGSSHVLNLVVNGQALQVSGAPNQTFRVGNARVIVNEQHKLTNTGIHVVAVHVYIYSDAAQHTQIGDAALGVARASLTCGCP